MAEKTRASRRRQRSRKAKPTSNGLGHNSGQTGQVPREVYDRHLGQLEIAAKAKQADDAAKKKRSALQNVYKAAKGDGCNVEAIKIARKLDQGDHVEAVNDYAEVGTVLDILESPLHTQFGLFAKIDRPAPVSAYLLGMQAGRQAAPPDNNPYADRPGSEEFVQWGAGYEAGQGENQDSLLRTSS